MAPLTGHVQLGVAPAWGWLGQAGREGLVGTMRELPEDRTEFMPTEAEEPAGSSQSAHGGGEASNDRGAKGRRKVKA